MTFQKGNKLGGRHKGSLNKATIAREERRAIFDEEVSKVFLNRIQEARPEYVLDQFLGKPPEIHEHHIHLEKDPKKSLKALQFDEWYKQQGHAG